MKKRSKKNYLDGVQAQGVNNNTLSQQQQNEFIALLQPSGQGIFNSIVIKSVHVNPNSYENVLVRLNHNDMRIIFIRKSDNTEDTSITSQIMSYDLRPIGAAGAAASMDGKRRRKSRSKRSKRCKSLLGKKIGININEGIYANKTQAIAVAYSQVRKRHPSCRRILGKGMKRSMKRSMRRSKRRMRRSKMDGVSGTNDRGLLNQAERDTFKNLFLFEDDIHQESKTLEFSKLVLINPINSAGTPYTTFTNIKIARPDIDSLSIIRKDNDNDKFFNITNGERRLIQSIKEYEIASPVGAAQ